MSNTMKRILTTTLLSTAALAVPALAETQLEAPELPPPSYAGETVEPDVTILETDRGTVYEYRIKGQLYMVRVQPQIGPAYYLLDSNGDGTLDVQQDHVWNTSVPQWILHSW